MLEGHVLKRAYRRAECRLEAKLTAMLSMTFDAPTKMAAVQAHEPAPVNPEIRVAGSVCLLWILAATVLKGTAIKLMSKHFTRCVSISMTQEYESLSMLFERTQCDTAIMSPCLKNDQFKAGVKLFRLPNSSAVPLRCRVVQREPKINSLLFVSLSRSLALPSPATPK